MDTDQTKSIFARAEGFREKHPEIKTFGEFLEWLRNNPGSNLTAAFWEVIEIVDYLQEKSRQPQKEIGKKRVYEEEERKKQGIQTSQLRRIVEEIEKEEKGEGRKPLERISQKPVQPQQPPQPSNINQLRQAFNQRSFPQRIFNSSGRSITRPIGNIIDQGFERGINSINTLASKLRVLGNVGKIGSFFGGGGAAAGATGAAAGAGSAAAAGAGGAAAAGTAGAATGGFAAFMAAGGWIIAVIALILLIVIIVVFSLSGINTTGNNLDYSIPFRDSTITIPDPEKAKQQIKSEFPQAQLQYWDEVVSQSIAHNWNPAFVLTLWIEETGASHHTKFEMGGGGMPAGYSPDGTPYYSNGHLGCAPYEDQTIDQSLQCLFNMRDLKNGGGEFSADRFESFMRQYSGEKPTGPFIKNKDFPSRVKKYYSMLIPSGLGALTATALSTSGLIEGVSSGNFVYYCQHDPSWGQGRSFCGDLFSFISCGPTSMAMVFSSFGETTTPNQMFDTFYNQGFFTCGGTSMQAILNNSINSWLSDNGFAAYPISNGGPIDIALLRKFLSNGYLIIGSQHIDALFSHIFVVSGIDTNNNLELRDPADGCTSSVIRPINQILYYGLPGNWMYSYALKKVR